MSEKKTVSVWNEDGSVSWITPSENARRQQTRPMSFRVPVEREEKKTIKSHEDYGELRSGVY